MMPIPPEHLVFVDFENVPDVDLSSIKEQPVQVTLLVGRNQKKLDLALVEHVHRLGERVRLIRGGASGHNALDLIISYHLGQAVRQCPGAKFYIVSKDTDFDPLIAHVPASGVEAERHRSLASLPFASKPRKSGAATLTPAVDRCSRLIARLSNATSTNRPATEKALRAHIRTALGKEHTDAAVQDVIHELTSRCGVRIDSGSGKIRYADSGSRRE